MSTRLSRPSPRSSPNATHSSKSLTSSTRISPTAATRIAAMHAQTVENIQEESENDNDESSISGEIDENENRDNLSAVMEGRLRLLQRHRLSTAGSMPEASTMSATRNETRANVRRRLTYLLRDDLAPELSPVQNAVKLLQRLKERVTLDKVDEAAIDYAVSVLHRDREYIHVPEALQVNQEDDRTHQWLQHTFTRAVHPVAAILKNELEDLRLGATSRARGLTKSHWVQLPYTATAEQAQAITVVLAKVNSWEFDVLELRAATAQRELQTLGWHLLRNVYGLVTGDEMVWCRWLQWAEGAYVNADYHNATHAADVLQTVHFFLFAGARQLFSDTQLLALLLSAIVHDLGHDGLNNAFHKGSMSDRAVAHNDRSIQESYHISTAFNHTLAHPPINIFALFEKSVLSELRSLMITMVLATDMSFHFEHLATFKKMTDAHGTEYENYAPDEVPHLLCVLLHGADISNPGKPVHLAKHWAALVVKEFFTQGAQEQLLGLPVSPNCDPKTTALEQVQIGFIKYIVLPFFTCLAEFLPQVAVQCLPLIHSNAAYWQSVAAKTVAEKKVEGSLGEQKGALTKEDVTTTATQSDKKPKLGQSESTETQSAGSDQGISTPLSVKVSEPTDKPKVPGKAVRRKSKKS